MTFLWKESGNTINFYAVVLIVQCNANKEVLVVVHNIYYKVTHIVFAVLEYRNRSLYRFYKITQFGCIKGMDVISCLSCK